MNIRYEFGGGKKMIGENNQPNNGNVKQRLCQVSDQCQEGLLCHYFPS